MPNWTYNTLSVSGNEEILANFVSKTIIPKNVSSEEDYDETHKFTFNILVPMPPALEGTTSPLRKLEGETEEQYKERLAENVRLYGAEDWYHWHLDNWGTKWDAHDTIVYNLEADYLNLQFNTAWSPPIEFYHKIFKMYPELRFEVIVGEESNAFCGRIVAENGEIIEDEAGDYIYQDEDGKAVIWDSNKKSWKYEETGIYIEDEDFYPIDINPYLI